MKPRLTRYREFIEKEFIPSLTQNKDYSLEHLDKELAKKIKSKQFERIVFTGMGCSAVVSDAIKGFFASEKIPVFIEVLNDYELNYLIEEKILKDGKSLVIISSYSGYSQEPINAYNRIKEFTKDIIFLTSGGNLEKIAKKEKVSVIYWKLKNPDREYPLFHVPQYFSILLDIFYNLGIVESNYSKELSATAHRLEQELSRQLNEAKEIAEKLEGKNITLLASPKWHNSFLKLAMMHFNEMAMAHAHKNYFHEFTHSEIASFTDPRAKEAVIIFEDKKEDEYTKKKMENLFRLLNAKIKQNVNIEIINLKISKNSFIEQFFSTLLLINYIALFLGEKYSIKSRELISNAAGNPWYNIQTIEKEEN